MDTNTLDDVSRWPEILISDNDTLRMLANCYVMCKTYFRILSNARTGNAGWNDDYRVYQKRFFTLLRHHCDPDVPQQHTAIDTLRQPLRDQDQAAALARCAALLHALSIYLTQEHRVLHFLGQPVVKTTSVALGSIAILISAAHPSIIAQSMPRLPRLDPVVSDMLAAYHPKIHLSPVTVGDWRLLSHTMPYLTASLLATRVSQRQIKIAVSPLTFDARLQGRPCPGFPADEPTRFLLDAVGDEASQMAVLHGILQQCAEQGVALLVLPELRVPPNFLQTIQTFLQQQAWADLEAGKGLLLVVAGSWHEPQEDGQWVNRSYVLDTFGEVVWAHNKLAEYRVTPDNVQHNPALKTQLGVNDHGGIEMIARGDALQFCDCALGRLAVAICAGFFHDPVAEVLKASGTTLFLVPAMTPDARPLAERGRTLIRSQHAATFVASCGTVACNPHSGQISENSACFYLLPAANAKPQYLTAGSATGPYLHVYTLQ